MLGNTVFSDGVRAASSASWLSASGSTVTRGVGDGVAAFGRGFVEGAWSGYFALGSGGLVTAFDSAGGCLGGAAVFGRCSALGWGVCPTLGEGDGDGIAGRGCVATDATGDAGGCGFRGDNSSSAMIAIRSGTTRNRMAASLPAAVSAVLGHPSPVPRSDVPRSDGVGSADAVASGSAMAAGAAAGVVFATTSGSADSSGFSWGFLAE